MSSIYLSAIALALLPVVILVIFIYRKDRLRHEPWLWLMKAFLYGLASAGIAIVVEEMISLPDDVLSGSFLGAAYNAFIVAATSEESAKLLMLWLLLRKNPHFDERTDGIVYATCVSLGFAGLENVGYLFSNLDNLATVGIMRAVLSVPGHFLFAVFMGYYYAMATYHTRHRLYYLLATLFVPIFLHGMFDFCLMASSVDGGMWTGILFLVFILLIRLMWIYARKRIAQLVAADEADGIGQEEVPEASADDNGDNIRFF